MYNLVRVEPEIQTLYERSFVSGVHYNYGIPEMPSVSVSRMKSLFVTEIAGF